MSNILICALLGLSLISTAQTKIVITPETKHQTIEFFGAADAWSVNFVGKYWDEYRKNEIADYLFSQETDASGNPIGIGLSIWRVNLGAGTLEQPGADIFPQHRRAESYMTLDGKGYDWGKCSGQEYFMQAAKERGCNQFILFSNSPLVQYTLNGKGYSASLNRANIKEDCYDAFADYLVDVAGHLMDKGYGIPYISPINEPQVEWVTPKQEGSPWRNSEQCRLIKSLDRSLGRSSKFDDVRIFISETARLKDLYEQRAEMLEVFENDTLECPGRQVFTFFDKQSPYYIGNLKHIDSEITAHPYHNHFTSKELREVHVNAGAEISRYGLDFHSSEWCLLGSPQQYQGITEDWYKRNHTDIQPALMMARIIHSDFVDANAVSWCFWQGLDSNGWPTLLALHPVDGDLHKGGFVTANKYLWTLGNYSRFVRPGYVRIALDGADDLDTLAGTAFISPDGSRIVSVFVNSSFEDMPVEIALPKAWAKRLSEINSYRTDARHDLSKCITGEKNCHTVNARGVTTIVMDFKK